MNKNFTEILIEAYDEMGYFEELKIRNYSGRCMYGKECPAISGTPKDINQFIVTAINMMIEKTVGRDTEDEVSDASSDAQSFVEQIMDYRTDGMGLGLVYYWPSEKTFTGEELYELEKHCATMA